MNKFLKLSIVTTSLAFILSACSTLSGVEAEKNLEKLAVGQKQNQVLNILGMPDTVIRSPVQVGSTKWLYHFKNKDRKGQHFFVSFRNGTLNEFGEIQSRDVAAAEENGTSGTCTRRPYIDFFEQSLCTHQ